MEFLFCSVIALLFCVLTTWVVRMLGRPDLGEPVAKLIAVFLTGALAPLLTATYPGHLLRTLIVCGMILIWSGAALTRLIPEAIRDFSEKTDRCEVEPKRRILKILTVPFLLLPLLTTQRHLGSAEALSEVFGGVFFVAGFGGQLTVRLLEKFSPRLRVEKLHPTFERILWFGIVLYGSGEFSAPADGMSFLAAPAIYILQKTFQKKKRELPNRESPSHQ